MIIHFYGFREGQVPNFLLKKVISTLSIAMAWVHIVDFSVVYLPAMTIYDESGRSIKEHQKAIVVLGPERVWNNDEIEKIMSESGTL